MYADNRVVTENSNEARDLFNQSRYGILLSDGRVQLSFLEALYLSEKGKLVLTDSKNKKISAIIEFEDSLTKEVKGIGESENENFDESTIVFTGKIIKEFKKTHNNVYSTGVLQILDNKFFDAIK